MRSSLIIAALAVTAVASAQRPSAPALSSKPGARYTMYLNFEGFNYTGQWGDTGRTPGNVPAYNTDGNASTFSSTELQTIRETWARFANAYTGMDINITTVDPAIAAGFATSDSARQSYYDRTQYLQHQILGRTNNWYGAAGGVSYVGVAQNANVASGRHTNWVFPVNGSGTSAQGMAAAGIHEDGHALRLPHQHDEASGAEYSTNNGASGNGSYAPLMGAAYYSQRGTWRIGRSSTNANDVAELMRNNNIGGLQDSGRGHTMETATALAINANGTVNVNDLSTKGFIMPKVSTGYSAGTGPALMGDEVNYTTDYFSFFANSSTPVSLTINDGNDLLVRGVADPGATMRSVLLIKNEAGQVVAQGIESTSTLAHSFTGTLTTGKYYAQVLSYGAYISNYEPDSRYFNMGGYFITGSGISSVPEPATLAAMGLGLAAMARRRRRTSK